MKKTIQICTSILSCLDIIERQSKTDAADNLVNPKLAYGIKINRDKVSKLIYAQQNFLVLLKKFTEYDAQARKLQNECMIKEKDKKTKKEILKLDTGKFEPLINKLKEDNKEVIEQYHKYIKKVLFNGYIIREKNKKLSAGIINFK